MTSHSLCTPFGYMGFFIDSASSTACQHSKILFTLTYKRFILSHTEHPAKKAS